VEAPAQHRHSAVNCVSRQLCSCSFFVPASFFEVMKRNILFITLKLLGAPYVSSMASANQAMHGIGIHKLIV